MKSKLLTSSFLPAFILFWVYHELVCHTTSIIYLTLVYTIEYPIKISSSTCLYINRCLPCESINDTPEYSRVKCYNGIPCACRFIHGLRNTYTSLGIFKRCRLGIPNLVVTLVDANIGHHYYIDKQYSSFPRGAPTLWMHRYHTRANIWILERVLVY